MNEICVCCLENRDECEIGGRCVDCREEGKFIVEIARHFLLCDECADARSRKDLP